MFHRNCPGRALVCRLILLHVPLNKPLVTMSVPSLCEGGGGGARPRTGAGGSRADLTGVGGQFTEEELAIHRAHREACEAKKQMYVDPSSGYKVFTEYAHLQRGKCCGSACRHCPYGQVNVKDPAMKKQSNSLFYV